MCSPTSTACHASFEPPKCTVRSARQPENALSPMAMTLAGMVISLSAAQSLNVRVSMRATPGRIVTAASAVQP